MITEILNLIYKTGMYSRSYISKKLDISEDMVEMGINKLLDMNLLKEDTTSIGCSGGCSGCSIANCGKDLVKTYTVTDKGLRLIAS